MQAGSEGELCPQPDSIGSSGSTSTLASSVIEVESGRDELALCQDDDDDLSPLPPPPTLSITEEIMQFINQSRAREGMAELSTEMVHRACQCCSMLYIFLYYYCFIYIYITSSGCEISTTFFFFFFHSASQLQNLWKSSLWRYNSLMNPSRW